jgi:hypothetical protein
MGGVRLLIDKVQELSALSNAAFLRQQEYESTGYCCADGVIEEYRGAVGEEGRVSVMTQKLCAHPSAAFLRQREGGISKAQELSARSHALFLPNM